MTDRSAAHSAKKSAPPQAHLRDDPQALRALVLREAAALGFSACGIAPPDTQGQVEFLKNWLAQGFHGEMDFLAEHLHLRADPTALLPGTRSVICVRMDYLAEPPPRKQPFGQVFAQLNAPSNQAIIARYARGRDYHKTLRGRLKQLAQRLEAQLGPFLSRPFTDSAPIFEKTLAQQAGLGWTGKHTLLIQKQSGSFFVLGELFTGLDIARDTPATAHCGSCTACLDICPTRALVAPYQLDARRCIAYLTIEYTGSIPLELRPLIGNRVFGCDDCQLICPWNRFARLGTETDFLARHGLDQIGLLDLWHWDETEFLTKTEGSPLRRTGYAGFMRNVAIALGNAPPDPAIVQALQQLGHTRGELVAEHAHWALAQQQRRLPCSGAQSDADPMA